ncbi:MAG: response regulator [bacterium]|nr:response regulator [bacterium]MDT8365226.1 response regulator [bacterium]
MGDEVRIRILIVDDEENIRHLLRLAFEEGFEVLEAVDGLDAVDKALEFRPHIILSDIMMPRLDGYGLYRKIKSRPETASIPFIFLSAKKDVDERVEGLEMGADDYITKPFSIKELRAKVRSITKKIKDMKELGSLEGLLKEVDLVDVIQLIEMGRKTGMLLLESSPGPGRVYFELGVPVYAMTEKWEGLEAFYTMLSWKEGRFKLDQKAVSIEPNIEHSGSQELLMEGVRLADEMEESLRSLPPLETILQPADDTDDIAGELRNVVKAYSGGADIIWALDISGFPPYRFYPLTSQALSKGLLIGPTDAAMKIDLLRKIRTVLEKL